MSLPYFRMFPTDYEADTSHLTLEEDGAYNRLLRLMWMTPGCSLPDDDKWICRRMRCDPETYERVVKPLIAEFFKKEKLRVFSPRLMEEWEQSNTRRNIAIENGRKGGRPTKPLKNKEPEQSNGLADQNQKVSEKKANQNQNHIPPIVPLADEQPQPKRKRRSSLPPNFPDEKAIEWAIKDKHLSRDQALAEAQGFRDYWLGDGGLKADWMATWRGRINRAVDTGRLVVSGANGGISETERAIQQDIERKKKRQQEGSAQPEHLFLAAGGMR